MTESFRAFAEGLIDYAGMFPPAELPLEEALRTYLRIRREPEAWMLGRFLCPAERLQDLAGYKDTLLAGTPILRISLLGRSGQNSEAPLEERTQADLAAIARFHERLAGCARVEALELRLPSEPSGTLQDPWRRRVQATDEAVRLANYPLHLYYELPPAEDWRSGLARGIAAIASRPENGLESAPARHSGFKLRCGGVNASAFPETEQVAFALSTCCKADIPFKATAGLHHPLRSFREEVGTKMHGFVNVFGAALLAYEHDLKEERIRAILQEEEPSAFRFSQEAFAWRDLEIGPGRIRGLRRHLVTSFGSCSFDEPRADLRALGFLSE